MSKLAGMLVISALFIQVACGSEAATPTQTPTPAAVNSATAVVSVPATPIELLTTELLRAPGRVPSCDHSTGAQISCLATEGGVQIEVKSNAANFARWSIKLGPYGHSLTGNETLVLHTRRTNEAFPNLYLVDASADRIAVPLSRFGLGEELRDVYVPLREIKDENGIRPNFGNVDEIQLVYEWADVEGALTLESLRFVSTWSEAVAVSPAAQQLADRLQAPAGFAIKPLAENLRNMTQIAFTPDGDMLVSLQDGRVWWYADQNGDGRFDRRHLYDSGYAELVGLLVDPQDRSVWLGGRGQLLRTYDSDGDGAADVRELRIDGLPWGRHQNNGLVWNPGPDPFTGEPALTWIYFGLGSTEDLEVGSTYNATVLRFPRDGQGQEQLEVVSRGNRNAYALLWAPIPLEPAQPLSASAWQLFASENGPDFNDAPDEVNHIRWQHDYGFPGQFGTVEDPAEEGKPYSSPVYEVAAHASADGIAYIGHPDWPPEYRTLYVTLFGEVFSPTRVGHTVERIALRAESLGDGSTFRGEPSDFITGLDRPLPLAAAPDGNLLVGDYATGVVYHVRYVGE